MPQRLKLGIEGFGMLKAQPKPDGGAHYTNIGKEVW